MKRTTKHLIIALCLCLFMLSGCGIRVSKTNPAQQVKQGKFQIYDPNDCSFTAKYYKDPNSNDPNSRKVSISWPNQAIEPNEPVSASYRFLDFAFASHPVVNGKLYNGKSVTLMVDTGCEFPLLAWDSIIRSQNMPVLPFFDKDGGLGVYNIPKLTIGELTLKNPPCFFMSQHIELHLLGMGLWKNDTILLGLPFLSRSFKYIAFDNPNHQVVLSKSRSFEPDIPAQWGSYAMNIINKPTRISVTIPLAGQNTEIGFDSGGGYMCLRETAFEKLRPYLDIRSEKKGTFLTIQDGKLVCCKVRVRNLTIGNRNFKRALIVVLPDDTEYLPEKEMGFLSLREFKDTMVVLDFENNLMWVKKDKGTRLEK